MLTKYLVVATRKGNHHRSYVPLHTDDREAALAKREALERASPHLRVRVDMYVTDNGKLVRRKTVKE